MFKFYKTINSSYIGYIYLNKRIVSIIFLFYSVVLSLFYSKKAVVDPFSNLILRSSLQAILLFFTVSFICIDLLIEMLLSCLLTKKHLNFIWFLKMPVLTFKTIFIRAIYCLSFSYEVFYLPQFWSFCFFCICFSKLILLKIKFKII